MCASPFLGGWPSIFALTGLFGIICSIFWFIFASDSPDENRFIKDSEKYYIIEETVETVLSSKEKKSIPWKSILTSKPDICLIIVIVI